MVEESPVSRSRRALQNQSAKQMETVKMIGGILGGGKAGLCPHQIERESLHMASSLKKALGFTKLQDHIF